MRRLVVLLASLALAATTLVAVATPAQAAARAQRITLSVNRTSLVSGQQVTLAGRTTPKAAKRTVHLQQRYVGSATWRTVRKVTTSASGRFTASLTLTSTRSSYFRAYLPKRPGYQKAYSGRTAKIGVRPKPAVAVTAAVLPAAATAGLAATVAGTVSPASGPVAYLQRRTESGQWATLRKATVSETGRYVVAFTPQAAGALDLRVYVPATASRAAGYSAVVRVPVASRPAIGYRAPARRQAVSLGIENIVNPQDWAGLRAEVDDAHVNVLHLASGRVEWTHFDRGAHPEVAAEAGSDHLARAIDELGTLPDGTPRGIDLVIDALVPEWIRKDPSIAGQDAAGSRARYMASAAALHDGAVGDRFVELARDLAVRYRPTQITFTELAFDDETFGAADLALYRRMTGEKDWPRDGSGRIDEESGRIDAWRSQVIGDLLARVRRALDEVTPQVGHRVQLAQDVLVDGDDPAAGRPDAGHDYRQLWQVVDKVVAWVYFDSGDRPAGEVSR
ncbi:MAG: hypothetical protein AAGC63_15215, partial [Propionicimonas sp.]